MLCIPYNHALLVNRVRLARGTRGMSQASLAGLSGLSRWTICRLERSNTFYPTRRMIEMVSRALDVPIGELFYWVDDRDIVGV